MRLEFVLRKSAVLTPSGLACLSDAATVNLTAGCAHQCVYCYANGYSIQPENNVLRIYSNLLEKLKSEIPRKRKRPTQVYFSPSSDLFQPVPEVLNIGYEILAFLLQSDFDISFLTKGIIPDKHFNLLQKYAGKVNAQIGLISCDETVCRRFEPFAAAPKVRLEQIRKLCESGIDTTVRLDPMIPNITDDEATLKNVCKSAASCGISSLSASVLFLRTAIKESLRQKLPAYIFCTIMKEYGDARRQSIRSANSTIRTLPLEKRLEIYNRLKRTADFHGLSIRLCGCKNTDIPPNEFNGVCPIASQTGHAVSGSFGFEELGF